MIECETPENGGHGQFAPVKDLWICGQRPTALKDDNFGKHVARLKSATSKTITPVQLFLSQFERKQVLLA